MSLDKLREWLIFFRAHTGILEAPIPALGAALALGSIWNIEVVLWAIAGLLYHYAGYGQNSYYDWKNGYDKDDPNKQHHPLNTGKIDPDTAKVAANGMVMLSLSYMVLLVVPETLPTILLTTAFVCGVIYNTIGKQLKHKYVFISIAHSMLFLIPYTYYVDTVHISAILIFLALFVHHTFQIAISGDMKDILQDESSILQSIGVRVTSEVGKRAKSKAHGIEIARNIVHTKRVCMTISAITGLQVALVIAAVYFYSPSMLTELGYVSLFSALTMALWFFSTDIISSGAYIREERMKNIALRELVGFWLIYTALIPAIGFNGYILAFIVCMLYLIIHSKFMWGTLLRPKV